MVTRRTFIAAFLTGVAPLESWYDQLSNDITPVKNGSIKVRRMILFYRLTCNKTHLRNGKKASCSYKEQYYNLVRYEAPKPK